MHVLAATRRTQGLRETDFSWTVDGELVRFPGVICADPECGCERSMAGIASSRATTTFEVVDRLDLDPSSFYLLLRDALIREGWADEDEDWIAEWADEHLRAASLFPAGTVLELWEGHLRTRSFSDQHDQRP